jgi:exopolysaccharide biosynthesis polyprenyl glycosylphosphotransferase
VVFIVPRAWLNGIEGAVRLCEEQGVKTSIALDLYDLAVARPLVTELEGMPMLTYSTTPSSEGKLALKRAIDLIGSAFLLLVVSPLFLIIAAAIKLTSKGPVFFRQTRVGLNGRHFILLKFRSMVVDAEQRLREIAHLNEMDGPVFKVRHDPRVTPVGRLLRKTSLDELPQLINVLRGEMSLVGPRPPVPSEVVAYAPWQKRRLSMKPGITCLWQVNGRNTIDFDQWMKLDLEYIDNWSLGLDLKIVGKTVPAVLLGKGAS